MPLSEEDYMDVPTFARNVRKHLKDDYDCVIAITSSLEGEGKSTLAGQLGLSIDPKNFSFEKNVLYSPTVKSMKDLIFSLPKYSVVDADEAIKILYKLKWGDKMSIFLNQLYALCRQENLATIMPMPRITDFTEFFRNHKIKFWLFIIERGTAAIFYKDWNPFSPDPWYMKENLRQIKKFKVQKKTILYSTDEKIAALSRCENFVGILKFDDLPEEHKTIYNAMKRKYAYTDMDLDTNNGQTIHLFESVKEILDKPDYFIKNWRGKHIVDMDRIMIHFKIGRLKATNLKAAVEDEIKKQGKDIGDILKVVPKVE